MTRTSPTTLVDLGTSHSKDIETKSEQDLEKSLERNPLKESKDETTTPIEDEPVPTSKKPLSFYLAFLSIMIMVLLVSLDSTALAVAIPVSSSKILN